jgi:hypothetical protein
VECAYPVTATEEIIVEVVTADSIGGDSIGA